jgi:hypothetical protein
MFTTRFGGISKAPWHERNLAYHVGDDPAAVAANRDGLSEQLGGASLVTVNQVHGAGVQVLEAHDVYDPGRPVVADAMVTAVPGLALTIQVADCLPVLFADVRSRVVAAAHAGRAGLAAGVLQQTIAAMTALGADVADIAAVVGPGVCGRCYEVPAMMRDEVAAVLPGSAGLTRDRTPSLDLPAGAIEMLAGLGLGQVRRTDICTVEDNRFFSHRRDGVTGRFAGVVLVEPDG